MNVSDILNKKNIKEVLSISPQTPLIDAAAKLTEFNVGLLVVTDNDKILGVISERDFVRRVIVSQLNIEETPVEKVMTKNVITTYLNESVSDALKKFFEKNCRHLPVLDESEKLVGMLTERDIINYLLSRLK